jgi:hypothetical protein
MRLDYLQSCPKAWVSEQFCAFFLYLAPHHRGFFKWAPHHLLNGYRMSWKFLSGLLLEPLLERSVRRLTTRSCRYAHHISFVQWDRGTHLFWFATLGTGTPDPAPKASFGRPDVAKEVVVTAWRSTYESPMQVFRGKGHCKDSPSLLRRNNCCAWITRHIHSLVQVKV